MNTNSVKLLSIVIAVFLCTSAKAQVFKDYKDSLDLGFSHYGFEFVQDDLWVAKRDTLLRLSFPELDLIEKFPIPMINPLSSDICSDNDEYIWVAEGSGSQDGNIHTFNISSGEFISSKPLSGIANYQIQSIDYHDGQFWISNWRPNLYSILQVSLDAEVLQQDFIEIGVPLPISVSSNFIFIGTKERLYALDKTDFKVVDEFETGWLRPGNDIYDSKIWITKNGDNERIFSIELEAIFSSSFTPKFDQEINLFPNPANQVIQFTNLRTNRTFVIYDEKGARVHQGNVMPMQYINIQSLDQGIYQIVLDEKEHFRFIKI